MNAIQSGDAGERIEALERALKARTIVAVVVYILSALAWFAIETGVKSDVHTLMRWAVSEVDIRRASR